MQLAARTIAERLCPTPKRSFAGREHEFDALGEAISAHEIPFVVAHVPRPGGRGESRLVQATLDAASAPAFALSLDCTQIEPTPRFFLRAVTRGFGEDEAQLEPDADRLVGMFPAARRLHRRPRSEL